MNRFLLPLSIFIVVVIFLGVGLKLNPREIPSPLVGKAAPDFSQPQLYDEAKVFSPADLRGRVWLLNFWASWCVPCRAEHPDLVATAEAFADSGVRFVGVVYQDDPAQAIAFLDELGWGHDYEYVVDPGSRAAISFGVFGIPETFFINPEGVIVGKIIGQTDAILLGTTLDQILRGEVLNAASPISR